jgi:hypothetical protein
MTKHAGLTAFTAGIAVAGIAFAPCAMAEQAAIANIDIKMSRNSSTGSYGVSAEVTNPNDFAVRDVRVRCTMEDDRANKLVSYDSTILATFPAKQKIVVPRLDVGAWPAQAARASCISSSAQRI